MKASELRLGNYLQSKNRIVTVTKIYDIGNIGIGSGDPYFIFGETPCLKAIPLTKEWLLKFGFKFAVDSYYFNGFCIWETECGDDKGNESIGYFYELRERCMMDRHIQYVHQLQNLYFALTGEELHYESK